MGYMGMAKNGDVGRHLPSAAVQAVNSLFYPVLMAVGHVYTLAGQLQVQLGGLCLLGVTVSGYGIKRDVERLGNPFGIGIKIPGVYKIVGPVFG